MNIQNRKSKTILIIGATSDVALSTAERFAKQGFSIQLAGRNINKLKSFSEGLQRKYLVDSLLIELNVIDFNENSSFISQLNILPDIVLSTVGYMGDQFVSEINLIETKIVLRTNFEAPTLILSEFANAFEKRGYGTIIGISSVAGDRGRASNYLYGAAKAGFKAFLSGLRNRLSNKNVDVITILPGYINTKMTKNIALPKILTASTNQVANEIFNSYVKKKDVVYVLPIWKIIMTIIKLIPEFIFKRTNL